MKVYLIFYLWSINIRKLSFVLSPNVNMKPGTNPSRRSSIFQCNRHQIDWTSSINICAISRKRTSALFFEQAYSPYGRRKPFPPPPPPKKKKKKKKKELPFFYTFQKLEERHDFSFYYIHFEITADPGNRIGSNWCDLFTRSTFFL